MICANSKRKTLFESGKRYSKGRMFFLYPCATRRLPITHTPEGEYAGLEEADDGVWDLYFGSVRLGQMDERTHTVQDAMGNRMRKRM